LKRETGHTESSETDSDHPLLLPKLLPSFNDFRLLHSLYALLYLQAIRYSLLEPDDIEQAEVQL
jgi:hypothetical protein